VVSTNLESNDDLATLLGRAEGGHEELLTNDGMVSLLGRA
jgi:hypothetical protein